MIIIRIEMHSARTKKIFEIGRMVIANDGTGIAKRCDYDGQSVDVAEVSGDVAFDGLVMRRGTTETVQRKGRVEKYPRANYSVWTLVKRMLDNMGF